MLRPKGLGLVLAISAAMPPVARAADVIVQPDWLKKPTAEQILGLWPKGTLGTNKQGRAVVSCEVSVQGALHDCQVVAEEPKGSGFGDAALALTPQFLMRPSTRNGVPTPSSTSAY